MAEDSAHLVILARDGVVNKALAGHVRTPDDWVPIPGSLESIARLNHAGFSVVVATNQSGIGEGLFGISELNAIHNKFRQALARVGGHVDAIFFCPHAAREHCGCRKPAPGLLREIEKRYRQSIAGVPVIGSTAQDADAALAAAARPIMLSGRDGGTYPEDRADLRTVPCFEDLATATCYLLDPSASA